MRRCDMPYGEAKIYHDGSHFIAIPYVPNPRSRRPKPPEEQITVVDENADNETIDGLSETDETIALLIILLDFFFHFDCRLVFPCQCFEADVAVTVSRFSVYQFVHLSDASHLYGDLLAFLGIKYCFFRHNRYIHGLVLR